MIVLSDIKKFYLTEYIFKVCKKYYVLLQHLKNKFLFYLKKLTVFNLRHYLINF